MAPKIIPYIHFNGEAEQVIRFYEHALGAKVEALMRYSEMPGASFSPEQKKLVMHSLLRIGESAIMVSDAMPGQPAPSDSKVQILLDFADPEELRQRFETLSPGGTIVQPPHEAFWGATFAVMTDHFGVRWLFNCDKPS